MNSFKLFFLICSSACADWKMDGKSYLPEFKQAASNTTTTKVATTSMTLAPKTLAALVTTVGSSTAISTSTMSLSNIATSTTTRTSAQLSTKSTAQVSITTKASGATKSPCSTPAASTWTTVTPQDIESYPTMTPNGLYNVAEISSLPIYSSATFDHVSLLALVAPALFVF